MKTIFFIALLISTAACAKSSDGNNQQPVTAKDACDAHLFNWQENCDCYEHHELIETKEGKKCVDEQKGAVCAELKNGYTFVLENLSSDDFNKCFVFENKKLSNLGLYTPPLRIELSDISISEKKELAKWADKNSKILQGLSSWPSAGMAGEVLVLTKKPDTYFMKSVFQPYQMALTTVDYVDRPISPKIFGTVAELTAYLAQPEEKSSLDPQEFAFDSRALALATVYKTSYLQNLKVVDAPSSEGCKGSCRSAATPISVGTYEAQYQEYQVENQIYRAEIVLRDEKQNVSGFIYLARQKVSLLVLIERDAYGLPISGTAYSSAGKKVYSENFRSFDPVKAFQVRVSAIENDEAEVIVGICENNFSMDLFKEKGIAKNLSFGPGTDNSYFGWDGTAASATHFWQGHTYFNEVGLNFSFNNYAQHSYEVSETLLIGNGKNFIGIAPLGVQPCLRLTQFESFWPQIKADKRVRVINMSVSNSNDETTCKTNAKDHPIMNDPDILWVVAAGNSGRTSPNTCPQYLAGAPNLIIVGATKSGSLIDISNKGRHFVDIAALGTTANGKVGTSFAAPRVSALAAEVFRKFPELSAHQVKLALLLAAKPTKNWALDVRSEGEIHNSRTLEYAKLLADGKTAGEAVRQIELCNWEGYCEKTERKLKLLETFE